MRWKGWAEQVCEVQERAREWAQAQVLAVGERVRCPVEAQTQGRDWFALLLATLSLPNEPSQSWAGIGTALRRNKTAEVKKEDKTKCTTYQTKQQKRLPASSSMEAPARDRFRSSWSRASFHVTAATGCCFVSGMAGRLASGGCEKLECACVVAGGVKNAGGLVAVAAPVVGVTVVGGEGRSDTSLLRGRGARKGCDSAPRMTCKENHRA